jgi:hypothetical protein
MQHLEFQKIKRSHYPKFREEIPYYSSNEEFLLMLDEINIRISQLILQRKHNLLLKVFDYYLSCEIFLQNYVSNIHQKSVQIYNIKRYNELIELRNFYNNFRTLLISQLAEYLMSTYNTMTKTFHNDLLKSTKMFTYFKKVLNFYIQRIKIRVLSVSSNMNKTNMEKELRYKEALKNFLELKNLIDTIPKNKQTFFALLSI